MSDPIMSPDGNFMWTGSEWISAPPVVDKISIQPEETRSNIIPWIGVLVFLISIFFPYLGSNSPMELLLGSSPDRGSPPPYPNIYSFILLTITRVMIGIFQIIFLINAISVSILLLLKKNVKFLGAEQLVLSLIFLMVFFAAKAANPTESITEGFPGLGFFLSCLSGILYCIKSKEKQYSEEEKSDN